MPISDPQGFILANTRLQRPPHVPEIELHLADEVTPIWRLTEEALGDIGLDPPFWAFAWAGGQGLSRYVLDHPQTVAGRTVVDLAAGSGLCAIAAMKAGAKAAQAADIDPFCAHAVALNARINGCVVDFVREDLLASPPPDVDVILAGDVFYEKPMASRVLAWLSAARDGGTRVLVGDPERSYFPKGVFERLATYQVAVSRDLEDYEVKRTGVYGFPDARS